MPQLNRIFNGRIRIALFVALMVACALSAPCSHVWAQSSAVASSSSASSEQGSGAPTMIAPIGPSDVLHIDVVDQLDLTHDYTVDGNGDITMLYVGKLHVSGLTPDQATAVVKSALGKIYVDPAVTLTLAHAGGDNITVTGSVQHQGSSAVRRDAHLNDVIQVALPTTDADLGKIQITRGMPGQSHTTLSFDLGAFLSNGDISNNPALQDGDVIFVPSKAPITYSVSVVGAIMKAGRYDVEPGTTVYDLIKLGGGLDEGADRQGVYVQPIGTLDRHAFDYDQARLSPESPNLNPVLKDGDKVVVPESTAVPVYSITGAVVKPGQYPLRGKVSLSDAEGIAEGVQDRAKIDKITVTRESANGAQVVKIDAKKDPTIAANFLLQPGDNVYIPQGSAPSHLDPIGVIGILLGAFSIFR